MLRKVLTRTARILYKKESHRDAIKTHRPFLGCCAGSYRAEALVLPTHLLCLICTSSTLGTRSVTTLICYWLQISKTQHNLKKAKILSHIVHNGKGHPKSNWLFCLEGRNSRNSLLIIMPWLCGGFASLLASLFASTCTFMYRRIHVAHFTDCSKAWILKPQGSDPTGTLPKRPVCP